MDIQEFWPPPETFWPRANTTSSQKFLNSFPVVEGRDRPRPHQSGPGVFVLVPWRILEESCRKFQAEFQAWSWGNRQGTAARDSGVPETGLMLLEFSANISLAARGGKQGKISSWESLWSHPEAQAWSSPRILGAGDGSAAPSQAVSSSSRNPFPLWNFLRRHHRFLISKAVDSTFSWGVSCGANSRGGGKYHKKLEFGSGWLHRAQTQLGQSPGVPRGFWEQRMDLQLHSSLSPAAPGIPSLFGINSRGAFSS